MDEIPRQGLRQLPSHNPRELSGIGVGAVYLNEGQRGDLGPPLGLITVYLIDKYIFIAM